MEVATNLLTTRGAVPVRDSKVPHGPALTFPVGGWTAFIKGVKDGEFPG
ncbi:DUF397 domain-containing protein [Streptomyces sp. NPDC058773]